MECQEQHVSRIVQWFWRGTRFLALTQAQIKQFVKHYGDWLKKGGNGTFFLFKIGVEFFAAAAYFFSDGRLGMRVRRFSLDRIFLAKKRHRLVVPRFNRIASTCEKSEGILAQLTKGGRSAFGQQACGHL